MRNYKQEYKKAIKNKVNLSIKVDEDLYKEFKEKVCEKDLTINEVIRNFMKEYK